MTRPWRRGEIRDAAWALAFALWCVAWVAGLVAVTQGAPDVVSVQGDTGLRQTVALLIPLPYGATLFAWGVIAFVVMWGLLRLRRWLDPDGQSLGAIRWALSSRSLNLALVLLAFLVVILVQLGEAGVLESWLMSIDIALGRFFVMWWWLILLVALAILSSLAMLCLLNPETLARDRFERWWVPFWPGIVALLLALLCWLIVPALTQFAWRSLPESIALWMPLQLLDYLIILVCDLAAFSWWFSRRRASNAKMLAARLFRWPTLRLYLGFDLLCGAWLLVAAVPVLLLAIFAIFFGPQYESWQSDGLLEMPAAFGLLMDVIREFREKEWLYLGMLVADLLLGVALARLLYRALAMGDSGGGAQVIVDGGVR